MRAYFGQILTVLQNAIYWRRFSIRAVNGWLVVSFWGV